MDSASGHTALSPVDITIKIDACCFPTLYHIDQIADVHFDTTFGQTGKLCFEAGLPSVLDVCVKTLWRSWVMVQFLSALLVDFMGMFVNGSWNFEANFFRKLGHEHKLGHTCRPGHRLGLRRRHGVTGSLTSS